jgi:drug/metabolite transporter (DMT)-like permease
VLGAALFLGEALGARELIATAAIVLGSIALSSRGAGRGERAPAGALWLPWSAAILRALAQVLSKAGLALWSSPFAAALLGYTVSTAAIWSASALPGYPRLAVNRRGVSWFALTGILNGGAVLALYKALSTGPVWLVSPIVSIYPLFTLALSVVILRHEPLTRRLAGGVVLTVGGVILLLAGGRT